MFGDTIGDSFGAGGLGLSGVGEGGGGRGEGIGLGNFGGLGHGAGTGTGQGIGNGRGRLGGGHKVSSPKIREGATQVNGRLPPEVIQRIVRVQADARVLVFSMHVSPDFARAALDAGDGRGPQQRVGAPGARRHLRIDQ